MALNEILRMQDDLERALAKPSGKRSWVMVIDERKCVGCHACAVSCMAENVCPPGTSYRKVFETEYNEYPRLDRFFMPTNCQHCDNPPCLKAANSVAKGAVSKRDDGIVIFDTKIMAKNEKAGQAAAKACPYTAVVTDQGGYYTDNTPKLEAYETRKFFENGKEVSRKNTKGAARKCTFCVHRLESGMLPACVSTCIGRAMYFGDVNDPKSLVSELLKEHKGWRFNEELGTSPRVYYLGYKGRVNMAAVSTESCLECHQ